MYIQGVEGVVVGGGFVCCVVLCVMLWCLCGGVVVGGGQNVPGYNMVYDTRYSLAQLRYGGWWAG